MTESKTKAVVLVDFCCLQHGYVVLSGRIDAYHEVTDENISDIDDQLLDKQVILMTPEAGTAVTKAVNFARKNNCDAVFISNMVDEIIALEVYSINCHNAKSKKGLNTDV